MKKKRAQQVERNWFIVMNSQLEYFSGLMYGGELVWCGDYNECKPLDNEAKFKTLQSLCRDEELIMEYIN
jgi:hypothetical protein